MKFAVSLRLDVQAEDAEAAARLFGAMLQQSGRGTALVLHVTPTTGGTTFHKLMVDGGAIQTERIG